MRLLKLADVAVVGGEARALVSATNRTRFRGPNDAARPVRLHLRGVRGPQRRPVRLAQLPARLYGRFRGGVRVFPLLAAAERM